MQIGTRTYIAMQGDSIGTAAVYADDHPATPEQAEIVRSAVAAWIDGSAEILAVEDRGDRSAVTREAVDRESYRDPEGITRYRPVRRPVQAADVMIALLVVNDENALGYDHETGAPAEPFVRIGLSDGSKVNVRLPKVAPAPAPESAHSGKGAKK